MDAPTVRRFRALLASVSAKVDAVLETTVYLEDAAEVDSEVFEALKKIDDAIWDETLFSDAVVEYLA